MSGFDTGVLNMSPVSRSKQHGPILRGTSAPVPAVGVMGDLYVNTANSWLYARRSGSLTSPWGRALFTVPAPYAATLKWFSSSQPSDSVGIDGDYCLLWGTYSNYGVAMRVLGPKAGGAWPSVPVDVPITVHGDFDALVTTDEGGNNFGQYLTGQVQKAFIEYASGIPPASWADFVVQYVGDATATDESYQTVFITAYAPKDGALWGLLKTYFMTTCGFTETQATTYLNDIWDLAAALPI